MSEFTWYSRLGIWAGAAVLIIQSVTGRSTGLMTLLAVLLLAFGLIFFIGGLLADARRSPSPRLEVDNETAARSVRDKAVQRKAKSRGAERPAAVPVPAQTATSSAKEVVPFEPSPPNNPVGPSHAGPAVDVAEVSPARVETFEVQDNDPALATCCARCSGQFAVGQLVAICPAGGHSHHAACWIDGRFACSCVGCTGAGSLEAPRSRAST